MSLIEKWNQFATEQNESENANKFWQDYFLKEKDMYKEILASDEVFEGKIAELSEKFGVDEVLMTGFLDGTNDSLLNARAIAPYLVRVARNRVLDLERARERQRKRSGEIFGFLSDDTFGAIDPGESRDTRLMDMDERLIRHEAIADFASRIGQDFVSDLVILADAMGIQRRTAANYFFTGKQVTLACIVIASFNHSMGGDFTSDFALLLREARAYTLPEHLRCDHAALLRHLYRKSSTAARQRMARRTGALAA